MSKEMFSSWVKSRAPVEREMFLDVYIVPSTPTATKSIFVGLGVE
jgi:hypothetical protein